VISPRDPVFNRVTGGQVTERQQQRLDNLDEAAELLFDAMHHADGSQSPGQHQEHTWSSRRMSIAATHIETALMFARKAALEAP
jgi:hypothetical protein